MKRNKQPKIKDSAPLSIESAPSHLNEIIHDGIGVIERSDPNKDPRVVAEDIREKLEEHIYQMPDNQAIEFGERYRNNGQNYCSVNERMLSQDWLPLEAGLSMSEEEPVALVVLEGSGSIDVVTAGKKGTPQSADVLPGDVVLLESHRYPDKATWMRKSPDNEEELLVAFISGSSGRNDGYSQMIGARGRRAEESHFANIRKKKLRKAFGRRAISKGNHL